MEHEIYQKAKSFKKLFPTTIAWRLKAHSKVVEQFLNDDEVVDYVFVAQKNDKMFDIMSTYIIALTNQRILMCQKRMIFGYFSTSVQRYMFNDLKIKRGIIWGRIYIDTIKEFIALSNVSVNALLEIERKISEHVVKGQTDNNKLSK
ncbi:MAG: PH domain-containing protein [Bacilli bacterium]